MRTYQHSGIVPVTGATVALAAGCLVAPLLGVAYSFSFYYIPFVYLNFLLACAFGAGIGWVVGYLARVGKIRNTLAVSAFAAVATILGVYAEWGSTVYAMTPVTDLQQLWADAGFLPLRPNNLVALMQHLFAEGSWGLSGNSTVHGWPLVALWIIEAGIIFGAATATAANHIVKRPFCENCQVWIEGQQPHYYVGDGSEPVWNEVQQGAFESLALTPRAGGNEPTYVRLTLSVCEGCSTSNYLTITTCKSTTDNKGNPKLEENDVVTHLILQPAQVEIVQAASLIAPEVGSTPLALAGATGSWQSQSSMATVPLPKEPAKS